MCDQPCTLDTPGPSRSPASIVLLLYGVMWRRGGPALIRGMHQSGTGPTLIVRQPHESGMELRQEIFSAKRGLALKGAIISWDHRCTAVCF